MFIKDKPFHFHVDCGATVNVLPPKFITDEEIVPTNHVLQMWNKTELKPLGVTCLTNRNPRNKKKYSVEFLVVNEDLTPLLGAKVIQHMELIKVHTEQVAAASTSTVNKTPAASAIQLIEEFNDVIEGDVGTLEGTQHLEVDPNVQLVVSPSRRVPSPSSRS